MGSARSSLNSRDDRGSFATDRLRNYMGAPNDPVPKLATPFLELNDLNSQGHAVGQQGWVGGVGGQEAAVFYNGTTVVTIGSPVGFCNGIRITENDRMRLLLNFGENVYDRATTH